MSFLLTTQPFFGSAVALPTGRNPLSEYILQNTSTGEVAIIIPAFGGILRQLILRPDAAQAQPGPENNRLFSVLEAPESPQALLAGETYASAILYPFASRIQHGIYKFAGTDYALPMNEARRNNALHGLVYEAPFTVIDQQANDHFARLTLRHTHSGHLRGYPFPFELTLTYTLAADGLTLTYSALNSGPTASPASFGWHPYFTLKAYPPTTKPGMADSDTILDDMLLTLPVQSVVVLGEDMMPNGTVNPLATNTFTLKNWQVDSPFLVSRAATERAESRLYAPKEGVTLVVSQETGPGKLNYVIVFTPPKRDSIAIEPQTANVNAFNTGDGLAILEPGDVLEGQIHVALHGQMV